jgi:DNA repair photolyase
MGTNTDPYQRAEGKYRLTRGIVEVLAAARNPFSILTKGTLVLRDLDVLTEASRRTDVSMSFSIGTLDEDVWRATEPGTPHPLKRVEAVARLNEAGIPCNVLVAPILPGLSDHPDQLEAVVGACLDAGATSLSPVLLHLRPGVREHYLRTLAETRPDLVALHEDRYARGAYGPKEERERISRLVHDIARRHRLHSHAGRASQASRGSRQDRRGESCPS